MARATAYCPRFPRPTSPTTAKYSDELFLFVMSGDSSERRLLGLRQEAKNVLPDSSSKKRRRESNGISGSEADFDRKDCRRFRLNINFASSDDK